MKTRSAQALLLAAALVSASVGITTTGASGATAWRWFKTDTHVHSVISADAFPDIGIHAETAKALGYDALFLTDHNGASSFHINNIDANRVPFEDTYTRWETDTDGSLSSSANILVSSPVNTGSKSLKLRAGSSGAGEAFTWSKRGPNFRSGTIRLRVSVYPTRIDPGSGLYVSASIGGDETAFEPVTGYTTAAGTVSHGKSTILVWQLGTPRAASGDPNRRVLTHNLPYTLNTWNHYDIDVTAAMSAIPAADRPLDQNAFTYLKMAARGAGGTAEGYFDSFVMEAMAPVSPADEFVYRTGAVDDFDTSTFRMFPSYEMGQRSHAQKFNFGITHPSQYESYGRGTDGILPTQQQAYPSMLNHPAVPGGVTYSEAVENAAYGADVMEVNEQVMVDVWDDLLAAGDQLLGSWSSDAHHQLREGKRSTYLYAPSLTFDNLMRSLFEGRSYMATNSFTGRVAFNLTPGASEPHPARYPVFVPATRSSIPVHLGISDDLSTRGAIKWIRGGIEIASDTPSGDSYDATKNVSLSGAFTSVRAEYRSSSGSLRALTQPLLFVDVSQLPADMTFGVQEITTPDNRGFTKLMTKGITTGTWSTATQALTLNLENRPGSLVESAVTTGSRPQRLIVDGTEVAPAASKEAFEAATTSSWFYDSTAPRARLKVLHAATYATAVIEFGATGDTTPPSVPSNVTATGVSAHQVDVTWTPSTDDSAVAGYTVYRDGAALGNVPATSVSYSDASVLPGQTYAYQVDAFDGSGNRSALSAPATVTTPTDTRFVAIADSYVRSDDPARNFGSSTSLRVDASPLTRSYLRFDVQVNGAAVLAATLRVRASSSSTSGAVARSVDDDGWDERGLTFDNAPAPGAELDALGAFSAGEWLEFDVSGSVSGTGLASFALETPGTTGVSLASRESTTAPELVVELDHTPANDTTPPTAPTGLTPTAVSSTRVDLAWVASTDDSRVANYTIYRDGSQLDSIAASSTAYTDTSVTPARTYVYEVDAVDTSGNRSARSEPVTVTTPNTSTLVPEADTWVDSASPTATHGSSTTLRVDGSPLQRAYLRFNVQVSGTVTSARLRVFANSASSAGVGVSVVSDNAWDEATMTYSTAPAFGAELTAVGAFGAGAWIEFDVSSAVAGSGLVSFGLQTGGSTAVSLASRESSNLAQLIVDVA